MTKDEAIKLYNSEFWLDMTMEEKVKFQLFEKRLCMPFDIFHKALEKMLDRPVFTHELGLNINGIKKEFLGDQEPPTIEKIINLIPEEKRLIII